MHGGYRELSANALDVCALPGAYAGDLFWIEGIAEQGARFGMDGARSFTPDRWLEDGDTVSFGAIDA